MNHEDPKTLLKIIMSVGLIFFISACELNSKVEIERSSNNHSASPTVSQRNPVANHQGGTVTTVTASGYKASASLGVQPNTIKGTTASGYEVRLNYPGQISR